MKATIVHPTKALITANPSDIEKIRKALTYRNTSIAFVLNKHKNNRWWKQKNPVTWRERLDELQAQLMACLFFQQGSQYWVRPGSLPYLSDFTNEITDAVPVPQGLPLNWKVRPDFVPYSYQSQSVERLIKIRHGNISLPTGCGKSFILLMLARELGLPTVVVTPSKSIFNELLKEFQLRLGKDVVGGYGDGKKDTGKLITIAIGKSLTMLNETSDAYDHFRDKQVMLVDESHTFAADQLEKVSHGVLNDAIYRIFVSATQTRGDGTEKLLQSIIGETVFEMSLAEAIQQEYLCPLNFTIIRTFSPSTRNIKDPLECKREHFLYNDEIAKTAAKIANAKARVKDESTLILVEELVQIENIIKYLEVPYAYVHSSSKKEAAGYGLDKIKLQEQVDKFNEGKVKVLIGTRAIATGTNIYPTHNTVNCMGGGSEIITKQGPMGRSTRLLYKSKYANLHKPKPYTTIYDFDVRGEPILDKQLQKRIGYYSEANGEIKYA
jgi:superfamily II DNA or RNA helicase